MNEGDGELPVTHTGTLLQAPGSGTLRGRRAGSSLGSLLPHLFLMSGHVSQTGSHGVFDLKTKAKIREEERGEQWALRVGFSAWWSLGRGPTEVMGAFAFPNAVCVCVWVSDHEDCPV